MLLDNQLYFDKCSNHAFCSTPSASGLFVYLMKVQYGSQNVSPLFFSFVGFEGKYLGMNTSQQRVSLREYVNLAKVISVAAK